MKVRYIAFLLSFLLLLTGCRTTTDAVTYFQDIDTTAKAVTTAVDYVPRLQPDDRLSITVTAVDPQAVAAFNMPLTSYQQAGAELVSTTPVLQTYLVSADGKINLPVLGSLTVAGKTCGEVTEELTHALKAYVNDPVVTVRLLNFKVSVLGEVNRPGTFQVSSERLSLLDAIGMAGDLTLYGNRQNVLLIREEAGERTHHRFDLTRSESLASPYFYLRQNDVVVVEPNDARRKDARYSQQRQARVAVSSTIISGVSVLVSLLIALLVK